MSGNGLTYEDIRVCTAHPEGLDRTVQAPGAAVVVEGSWDGEACTVRCLGGCGGFIRYAIQAQGYGEIVEEGLTVEAVERAAERLRREAESGERSHPFAPGIVLTGEEVVGYQGVAGVGAVKGRRRGEQSGDEGTSSRNDPQGGLAGRAEVAVQNASVVLGLQRNGPLALPEASRTEVASRFILTLKHRLTHSDLLTLVLLPLRRPFLFVANLLAEVAVLLLKLENRCLKVDHAILKRKNLVKRL